MNRNLYRLVQNTLGLWVAVPEIARGQHKGGGKAQKALLMAALHVALMMVSGIAHADRSLPVALEGDAFAARQARYSMSGNTGTISQYVDKAVTNFRSFNVGVGNDVVYARVDPTTGALIPGAAFNNLTRIFDTAPSVIAGRIHAAEGQSLNLMMINQNGILFANGAQVDVNSFTASSLNMDDKYFLKDLAPVNNVDALGNPIPQFVGDTGFVKLLEGARITAGNGGSVLLIAPTVTNRGNIETKGGGQTILAAGNKVYLIANQDSTNQTKDSAIRGFLVEVDNTNLANNQYNKANATPSSVTLDGETIQVADGYDKVGNSTNIGSIIAAKGNITMVGLAVNQMGRATATSSVSLNGSIYLSAKDTLQNKVTGAVGDDAVLSSSRTGKLTVGANSETSVVLETAQALKDAGLNQIPADTSTRIAAQDYKKSAIRLVGKDIDIQQKALIKAPSGTIDVIAVTDPSVLTMFNSKAQSDPFATQTNNKEQTHIFVASDAVFDVSGVSTEKSVADNYLQITLRGDELKDSPVNRDGILRGQKVWVDLIKGSPLVANIEEQKANMTLTLADSNTKAGAVNLKSTGEVVVDQNAQFNLAGGKTTYTDAIQSTTKLIGADGKIYTMDKAPSDVKYTGIVGRTIKNHAKWGVTETSGADQKTLVAGYIQGDAAGTLGIQAANAYFAGNVNGSTTTGVNQAVAGSPPAGANLTINNNILDAELYGSASGINQNVVIGSGPAALDANFKAGDNLSATQQGTLYLDSSLLGGTGVNRLTVNSVKNVAIDQAITLAPKGVIDVTGHNIDVNANIKAESGTIKLSAKNINTIQVGQPHVTVADNVTLSTAGGWYNDTLIGNVAETTKTINAGTISLSASQGDSGSNSASYGVVSLGDNSVLDVSGGGYMAAGNKLKSGNGGNLGVSAWKIATNDLIQSHFNSNALGTGGTLSVSAANVKITDAVASNQGNASNISAATLWLNPAFFQQGFGSYEVTGLKGVEVMSGTTLNVQTQNLLIQPNAALVATGANINSVTASVTLPDQFRKAASLTLKSGSAFEKLAQNPQQANTLSNVLTYGVTTVADGAVINTDAGGAVSLSSAKDIEVDGTVRANAGAINIKLTEDEAAKPLATAQNPNRVHLGQHAVLDVSGIAQVYPNAKGLQTGTVLSGGTVSLQSTSYVDTEAGALIDVHGASPVNIDVMTESGKLGKLIGSDAGSVSVSVGTGAYLDNTFSAAGGSENNKGGTIGMAFSSLAANQLIHVGEYSGISPTTIPSSVQSNQIYADLPKLVNAGFDNISLTSGDKIRFEGNTAAGLNRAVPLQSLQLNAPTFQSDGGNTQLQANIVKLSHGDSTVTSATPVAGNGHLSVKANLIELTGQTNFSGFTKTDAIGAGLDFDSAGEFRLTGKNSSNSGPLLQSGGLNTLADVNIHAGLVTPSTLTNYTLNANDRNVNFFANGAPSTPISVFGQLTVNAKNINQSGNIIAPYGSITLNADNTNGSLVLGDGGITSVGVPAGTILPFGKTSNGITFYEDITNTGIASDTNTIKSADLATYAPKKISLNGKAVDIKSAATVDISGGGDIQAWEFSAGPGGSADILAKDGYYAIVPSYKGIAAPSDPQKDGNASALGQTVYLSGGNGLAAGFYTLMPAHYALLPGAFVVKTTGGVSDLLPGSNFVKQDGTSVMAGFLTDSRQTQTTPVDARWTGFEVLSRDQISQRSQYTLTSGANFFAGNLTSSLPADAGLLQISTQTSLNIAGQINATAAAGGRGSSVDISANKLAIVDGTAVASDEVALDVTSLNKLNADSLLLGGTRSRNSDGTITITTKSNNIRMDGQAANPLTGEEIILTAKDTITLENNSKIVASGKAGTNTAYKLTDDRADSNKGNGALLRVATNYADVTRNEQATRVLGSIVAGVNTQVVSSNAIIIDATKNNAFKGQVRFEQNGQAVAGNLTLGASRISIGDNVPTDTEGLTFNQQALDTFSQLNSLNLRSYSAFDFYGSSTLGEVDNTGKFSLANLTLQSSNISGKGTASDAVNINAANITIANKDNITPETASNGQAQLNLKATQLTLGANAKKISGFNQTNIKATEIVAQGINDKGVVVQGAGKLTVVGDLNIQTARMTGGAGAIQEIEATGNMVLDQLVGAANLTPLTALGTDWTLKANAINFDTKIESHGGNATLIAKTGDVVLGANANIDVSGQGVQFYDQTRNAPAGNISLTATQGNVTANAGSTLNVSAAAGGNAGSITASAVAGNVDVVSAHLLGANTADTTGSRGTGASFTVDAKTITDFNGLNHQLNNGGFEASRNVRLRTGDLSLTQSDTGTIKANNVLIAVDAGKLNIDNTIDATGANGGMIGLYAHDNVTLTNNAQLQANATAADGKGGKVTIGTSDGALNLQGGSINVADGKGADSGQVLLRTPRTGFDAGNGVAVTAFNTNINGANSVVLEAVKTYNNINTLTANMTSGTSLGIDKVQTDTDSFMSNKNGIIAGLGSVVASLADKFHLRGGAEVRSAGDMTVQDDIDLYRANRAGGEPGTLTLRAAGNLNVKGSMSDGFDENGLLASNNSWSYRLVAGADTGAANPLAVNTAKTGDFTLSADKLIRTGTGDIQIATGGDFTLLGINDTSSVIYTAGKLAPGVDGYHGLHLDLQDDNGVQDFTPQFAYQGGSVSIDTKGNVTGAKTNQLYTDWLYRMGNVNADGKFLDDTTIDNTVHYIQTAWWVNHDSFHQGIATFGGGDIKVNASGDVTNLSLSAVTNGRMTSDTPNANSLVVTGGGDVAVHAGGDIKGGNYYVEVGNLQLNAQGAIGSGTQVINKDYYPVIALGNASADLFARKDVNIETVINPMSLTQKKSALDDYSTVTQGFILTDNLTTYFTTYGDKTSLNMTSLSGNANVNNYLKTNQQGTIASLGDVFGPGWDDVSSINPLNFAGTLKATALQGDVNMKGDSIGLFPQANGQLELMAKNSVNFNPTNELVMSDQDLNTMAFSTSTPANTNESVVLSLQVNKFEHSSIPLHINDNDTIKVYAMNGDIIENSKDRSFVTSKAVRMIAGRDIVNPNIYAQNLSTSDVTYIKAGRDIVQSSQVTSDKRVNQITLSGPGVLEVEAGRNIDFGGSYGILTQGNLENNALPSGGATVRVAAGVPNGVDYTGAIDRLVAALNAAATSGASISDSTLWEARWLLATDNPKYATVGSKSDPQTLLAAVQGVRGLSTAAQEDRVRNMFYQALRDTGRDHNDASSPYFGQYTRGYDATELLFPGINEKNVDGTSKNYAGSLNLFTSRIKTTNGGDIEFMVPGGGLLGGLAQIDEATLKNTSALGNKSWGDTAAKVAADPGGAKALGIVAVDKGSVRGFTLDSMVVNQSRILTTGGGDIMLWASNGDIDAGKGKKTSVSIPPPIVSTKDGVVSVTVQGAATGSGIGALGGFPAPLSSVDLIAPKGTVNAGDAGIRAGNLNIAAQTVLGADNITATGTTSGVPVSDAGALSGSLSAAAGVGSEAAKSVSEEVAKSAQKQASNVFAKQPSASFISVDVISFGE